MHAGNAAKTTLLSMDDPEDNAQYEVIELDEATNSELGYFVISVDDRKTFRKALGIKPKQCYTKGHDFHLTRSDMHWLALSFGLRYQQPSPKGRLSARLWIHDLPYEIHTRRELLMMLEGRKPMAVFSFNPERENEVEALGFQPFNAHVAAGTFEREVETFQSQGMTQRYVFFTCPGEEWRVKAYMLMVQMRDLHGHDVRFERMEGLLLGYTEAECDLWMEAQVKHWGDLRNQRQTYIDDQDVKDGQKG